MSTELFDAPNGRLNVIRYAAPAGESDRRRYQFAVYGETDNCGKRHAWSWITHEELRRLVAVLALEIGTP